MKTDWWKDLKGEEAKAQRVADVKANRLALDLLIPILERKLEELDQAQYGKKLYDNPNWAYMQADLMGCKRTINEILELVTLDKE